MTARKTRPSTNAIELPRALRIGSQTRREPNGQVYATVTIHTPAASPIERVREIPSGRAGLKEVLWIRGGYGPIALRMTREYPLTGVGAGSYRILAPDYWRAMANEALPPDNAQNSRAMRPCGRPTTSRLPNPDSAPARAAAASITL